LLGIFCLQTSCYAHQGHSNDVPASQWFAWSEEACHRGDERAASTLLERGRERTGTNQQEFDERLKDPCPKGNK
jgi:hypothetical protein